MREKVELLINTGSRTARQQKELVLETLHRHGFDVTYVYEVNRKHPLDAALRKVRRRKPPFLIVGGGDGTVSSALDRLVTMTIEIGIIPLGTTNNFARSLNMPLTIEESVSTIRNKAARVVDLGKIDGDYFTNVAGVGLSARIADAVTDKQKRRWGRFAYALVGLRQLFTYKPFLVTLQDPDKELSITMETRQIIIANGRYHAGKEIAGDAKIDNAQLIIFALGGRSLISFIKHMTDFYMGRRKKVAHASYFIGRRVDISTNQPQLIELDGEVKHKTPVHASVEAATIKVRA